MKRIVLFILVLCLCFSAPCYAGVSSGMVLMEASTCRVLASDNPYARLPMASLTKIMTALVVINKIDDLDEKVKIDERSVGIEGSSMYLKVGQVISIKELLYGLMLVSGNDAATALALYVGGSIEGFAEMMNETAAHLGLVNTHFLNPSGLYEDGHYTTAFDFAKLTAYALQNDVFAEIVKSQTYQLGDVSLVNHNRLLRELEGCIGVKTGYTKVCGRCLVSAVERDGVILICVTLNYTDDWNVHKNLYAEHFKRCERVVLLEEKEIYSSLKVAGGHTAGYYCPDIYGVIIDGKKDVKVKTYLPPFIYANKEAGDEVGRIEVICDEIVLASSPLILDRDTRLIEKTPSFFSKLFEFILQLFGF